MKINMVKVDNRQAILNIIKPLRTDRGADFKEYADEIEALPKERIKSIECEGVCFQLDVSRIKLYLSDPPFAMFKKEEVGEVIEHLQEMHAVMK